VGADAAPVRHLSRAREEIVGCAFQIVLIAGFVVALGFFMRSVAHLFERHGDALNPWYLRFTLLGIGLVMLLTLRRLWRKIREFGELRREIRSLGAQVNAMREAGRRKDR
jgi:hypothetical protein